MLTKLQHQYKKLTSSKDFKETGYLCSAFIMCDPSQIEKQDWQLDFYNENKDTITSYVTEPSIKVVNEDSEVYKENKEKLEKLEITKDLLEFKKLIKIAEEELAKIKETANKVIIILQKQKDTVWNLTFVTNNFNLINLKINAVSGKVLENKKVELLNWGKNE